MNERPSIWWIDTDVEHRITPNEVACALAARGYPRSRIVGVLEARGCSPYEAREVATRWTPDPPPRPDDGLALLATLVVVAVTVVLLVVVLRLVGIV